MKTEKQIEKMIKSSLMSDNAIKVCLDIHRENKGAFNLFVSKIENDIEFIVNNNDMDIHGAYLFCKENRTIRLSNDDSLAAVERCVVAMAAELSKYRNEIVTKELLSQVVVINK